MTDRSVLHSTFTLERTYAAPPAAAFAAWADRDTKAKWFAAADDGYSLHFGVGGTEAVHGGANGVALLATSSYHDIVTDRRIVYSTALFTDEVLSTVSLTTVQFEPAGVGTRLTLTEQDTFLDGQEKAQWRQQGTGDWLDALGRHLTDH